MAAKEIIGLNIRKHRDAAGIKQEDLAKMIGIRTAAMSQIETGKTDVSVTRIEQIAEALQVDFYTLVNSPHSVTNIHNSPNAGTGNSYSLNTDPALIESVLQTQHKLLTLLDKLNDKLDK